MAEALPAARTDATSGARLGELLTWRERRVLALLAEGYTNGEIGAMLRIAPSTVAHDVRQLRTKLGARNRAHAVGNWFRAGG
jgi:DNA-binding CsgD family transcriptional regulator